MDVSSKSSQFFIDSSPLIIFSLSQQKNIQQRKKHTQPKKNRTQQRNSHTLYISCSVSLDNHLKKNINPKEK